MLREHYIARQCAEANAEAKLHGWAPIIEPDVTRMMQNLHLLLAKLDLTSTSERTLLVSSPRFFRPLGARKLTLP
jgi:hypothetical protein